MSPLLIRIILSATLISFSSNAWALTERETLALINAYRDSLAGDNDALIRRSWEELNSEPEAIAYLKENFPAQYTSFQLQGLAWQWKELTVTWEEGQLEREGQLQETREKLASETQKVLRTGPVPNGQAALRYPNLVTVATANNALLSPNFVVTDNRSSVLEFPNQLRPANQEIIRNRVETLLGPRPKAYGLNPSPEIIDHATVYDQPY